MASTFMVRKQYVYSLFIDVQIRESAQPYERATNFTSLSIDTFLRLPHFSIGHQSRRKPGEIERNRKQQETLTIPLQAVRACVLSTLSRRRPWPLLPALFPAPLPSLLPTSTPYSILGPTALLKSKRVYLCWMPTDGLANRRHARAYFMPLATALANCSLKRTSSSIITPRNL